MIAGPRIFFRPIEVDDLVFLRDLANDPRVSESVVGWSFPVSLQDQVSWLDAARTNPMTKRLMVVERSSHAPVGLTGLWDIDWHNQSALTALKLHPDYQGRGLGTEAVMTVMAWAFYDVGLRRLHSTILERNLASAATYVKKCGWRIEGTERQAVFRNGDWQNLHHVAILREEFDRLPAAQSYIDRLTEFPTK